MYDFQLFMIFSWLEIKKATAFTSGCLQITITKITKTITSFPFERILK